jgi:hypothetical protein
VIHLRDHDSVEFYEMNLVPGDCLELGEFVLENNDDEFIPELMVTPDCGVIIGTHLATAHEDPGELVQFDCKQLDAWEIQQWGSRHFPGLPCNLFVYTPAKEE